MHTVLQRVRREAVEQDDSTGTTPGQYRLLRTIGRADGPQRLGDIAAALGIAPRSVTSKVDDAESAGLVRRLADVRDRRATRVELTHEGRAVLEHVSTRRAEQADRLLSDLSAAERDELLHLLRRVGRAQHPACCAPVG